MICRKTIITDRTANLSRRAISFILHFIPLYCSSFTLTLLTFSPSFELCCSVDCLKNWENGNMTSFKAQKYNSACMGRHADDVLYFAHRHRASSVPAPQLTSACKPLAVLLSSADLFFWPAGVVLMGQPGMQMA